MVDGMTGGLSALNPDKRSSFAVGFKMNVVYDLSIFGVGEKYSSARAGIYRVVESLARALMDSGRCSIHYDAFEEGYRDFTLKHLLSSSEHREIFLPYFAYSRVHHELTGRVARLNNHIAAASGIKKTGWRSARKLAHLSSKLFHSEAGREKALRDARIFHSPFYAVPPRVRKHRNISSFLTVYDLIPILYPQFFETAANGSEHLLKTIVDGIGREDWVVCISQKTREDLCNYRRDLDPARVFVTTLGASKWFYRCKDIAVIEKMRSKLKIPPGRYVLSVCTLEPRKNLAHLIRCFSKLIQQEQLSDLNLVLVGSLGWKYQSIFAELTSTQGLRDRIIITGYVADEDMAALYSGSLFFVYPSFYEGFGLPPLEAMQCGVPVITSNTSSLPEVVGDSGIMVDPKDGDALCAAMLQLACDGRLRAELSEKSLKQAAKFSWAKCAEQTLNAYETAVKLS